MKIRYGNQSITYEIGHCKKSSGAILKSYNNLNQTIYMKSKVHRDNQNHNQTDIFLQK